MRFRLSNIFLWLFIMSLVGAFVLLRLKLSNAVNENERLASRFGLIDPEHPDRIYVNILPQPAPSVYEYMVYLPPSTKWEVRVASGIHMDEIGPPILCRLEIPNQSNREFQTKVSISITRNDELYHVEIRLSDGTRSGTNIPLAELGWFQSRYPLYRGSYPKYTNAWINTLSSSPSDQNQHSLLFETGNSDEGQDQQWRSISFSLNRLDAG